MLLVANKALSVIKCCYVSMEQFLATDSQGSKQGAMHDWLSYAKNPGWGLTPLVKKTHRQTYHIDRNQPAWFTHHNARERQYQDVSLMEYNTSHYHSRWMDDKSRLMPTGLYPSSILKHFICHPCMHAYTGIYQSATPEAPLSGVVTGSVIESQISYLFLFIITYHEDSFALGNRRGTFSKMTHCQV